jgi:hypothetical protein
MAKEKAIASPTPPRATDVEKRSVQVSVNDIGAGPGGGNSFVIWMASIADSFIPWGQNVVGRDRQLRDWWYTESTLAGAIYSVCMSNAAMRWVVEGPDRTVKAAQDILTYANKGKGWRDFCIKGSIDFYTQDNAWWMEVIRASDSPSAPVLGINHLESSRCQRTGNTDYPCIYQDADGRLHKMPWYSVVSLEEFPSPIETMYGVQYCAVTRILRAAQVMRDIMIYRGEKVGGRDTEAIHIVGGVEKSAIEDVKKRKQETADNRGIARYLEPIIISSLDPQTPPSHITLNMKSLPEAFDIAKEFELYISQIALGLGRDYQEFAPLPRGQLGSGQQSEILHLKTRGKGPATWMDLVSYVINAYVFPKNVEFRFEAQDIEHEQADAGVKKTRAETRKIRIDSGEIGPVIARQLAQDEGDLDMKYLELMGEQDLTPDMVIEQAEKPESPNEEQMEEGEKEVAPRFPFSMWRRGL